MCFVPRRRATFRHPNMCELNHLNPAPTVSTVTPCISTQNWQPLGTWTALMFSSAFASGWAPRGESSLWTRKIGQWRVAKNASFQYDRKCDFLLPIWVGQVWEYESAADLRVRRLDIFYFTSGFNTVFVEILWKIGIYIGHMTPRHPVDPGTPTDICDILWEARSWGAMIGRMLNLDDARMDRSCMWSFFDLLWFFWLL